MSRYWLLLAVLLPIAGGAVIHFLPLKTKHALHVYVECIVLATSVIVICLMLNRPEETLTIFQFTGDLSVTLQLDGLGTVFAAIVSVLWPLATLYAFEYMSTEEHEYAFFSFYTVTYGITLGIAFAENILTLYFFYEMLTLVTLPLILHPRTREAVLAGRSYLYYSLGGAAFAFIGMIFILYYGSTSSFTAGGVLDLTKLGSRLPLLRIVYVMCFCGFSVKAAMWPFSYWLPKAGVAPTPVTALLHAVAVVKAGAFAVIRVTYYSFGTDLLAGSWAQHLLMCLVIFTIVYGCSRAVKETHLKRRLAWSTVSNLSYILFGCLIMTPAGLVAALAHMLFHAVMKICSFFCAGAVQHQTGKMYITQLDGLGWRMPKVFLVFTVSALALMGVPGLCGFVSKWYLAKAAIDSGSTLALVGVAALMISALLTAIYMLTIVIRAFYPSDAIGTDQDTASLDPGWRMMVPLVIFVVLMVAFGVYSGPIVNALTDFSLIFY